MRLLTHQQETRQWQATQPWPSQWVSQPAAQFSAGPLPSLVDQQPAPLQPCSLGVFVHQHSTAKDQFSTVQEAVAAAAAFVAVTASLGSQLPTGTSFMSEPDNCMVLTVPKLPVPSVWTESPLAITIPVESEG
jgi:hypothetical protein